MGIVELIEIGLAGADKGRLAVTTEEPTEISDQAVAGLAQVVSHLVGIANALSPSEMRIVVSGGFEEETYVVSISTIPTDGTEVLNRMWADPEVALDLVAAARLAARHRLEVEYLPGGARLTVPAHLVSRVGSEELRPVAQPLQAVSEESSVDFVPHELDPRSGGHSPAGAASSWSDSEAFLEEVFAPLMREWEESGHPATVSGRADGERGNVALLRMRVPGESYSADENDSPSTAAAEGAVDLRSALSTFDEGRRSAQQRDAV